MSHFSHIKTCIRDLNTLESTLSHLGIDWKPGPANVKGYRGQNHLANIVIEQSNDYDIGFAWNGSEYELVADLQFWQQNLSVQGFLNKIMQNYAYQKIIDETADQGFTVAEREQREDGSIKLVLQRWG